MVYYNTKKNNLLLKLFNCLLLTIYAFMCLYSSFVYAYFSNDSDNLTITFDNQTFTLPSWLTGKKYFFSIYKMKPTRTDYGFTFIYFEDNDMYIKAQNTSSLTMLYSSNNENFKTKQVTYITNIQNAINEYIQIAKLGSTYYTDIRYTDAFNEDNQNVFYQTNVKITDKETDEIIFSPAKFPEVTTSVSDLENLSANGISISANSWSEDDLYILFYNTSFNNSINDRTEPLQKFLLIPYLAQNIANPFYDPTNSTSTNIQYYIPISNLGFPLNIGNTYEIRFATIEGYVDPIDTNNYYNYYNFLGDPYTFTISNNVSQDTINTINQNIATETEKNYNQELNNSINNQTNSINNINNSITDTNIDTTFDLPTDTTQDITQNGINNIFTNIYNSFTSGTAQDIVFPIPFTEKNITLQANYNYIMLSSNGLSWVITFIRAFWWYFIGRFIITDIANKIKKIKSGDVENIENNNIRSEML